MSDSIETSELTWNPAETYKRNDPRGWGGDPSRGAAMGRTSMIQIPDGDNCPTGFTIHVEHILLIEGYDPNGTYFGSGGPLFWVYAQAEVEVHPCNDGGVCTDNNEPTVELATLDYVERFVDLEDAVRIVRETWPHAHVIGSEDWCDELVEKYLDEEYERERDEVELLERLNEEAEEDEDDVDEDRHS